MIGDGGPAFPHAHALEAVKYGNASEGMSLRDYFAAHSDASALDFAKELSFEDVCAILGIESKDYKFAWHWPALLAKARLLFADAMLIERAKASA